jgi:3-phosphoshikimate 1-carboxyvinyltransferase
MARDFNVPGDISSAAFFIAAATLLPSSELHIEGVGINPTRTEFPRTLSRFGAHIDLDETDDGSGEPQGRISVRGVGDLASYADPQQDSSSEVHGLQVARLIDELPMLAVIATQIEGGLTVRDAAELRVKETDRIAATLDNLRRMGAETEEYADGFTIHGRTPLRGAVIDSYGDHRIAMAFAVAALIAEGSSEIRGAEAVGVSFPEFFELLESIVER